MEKNSYAKHRRESNRRVGTGKLFLAIKALSLGKAVSKKSFLK